MQKPPSFIVVDCETTGLHPVRDRLHGFSICLPDGTAWYELAASPSDRALTLLANSQIAKINHNIRFDLKFLRRAGLDVEGRFICTLQMFKMLDENAPAGLKDLSPPTSLENKDRLDALLKELKLKHVGEACALLLDGPAHPALHDAVSQYCIEDTVNTLALYRRLSPQFMQLPEPTRRYYFNEIMPAELAVMEMELRGVNVDLAKWAEYKKETEAELNSTLRQLNEHWAEEILAVRMMQLEKAQAKLKTDKGKLGVKLPPFLWSSTTQVGQLLYDVLKQPVSYTDKGNRKVDEAVIRELNIPNLSSLYGQHQKWKKELSTYAEGFLDHVVENRAIYSTFPQLTVTGRFASSDPNMQNIPRDSNLKGCLVPPPGHLFIYADYSQIELRIAAHNSQDPVMLSWFKQGIDPHAATARAVFGLTGEPTKEQRQAGKALNFALIYDAGPYRLSEMFTDYGLSYDADACRQFRNRFFETHHVYRKHLDSIWATVQKTGQIMAANGRIRRIPDALLEAEIDRKRRLYIGPGGKYPGFNTHIYDLLTKKIAHAKKQAFNFPVQSVGASVTKAALIALQNQGFKTVLSVHDSIVIAHPESHVGNAAPYVQRLMETAYPLSVPVTVDMKILRSLDEADVFFTSNNTQSVV